MEKGSDTTFLREMIGFAAERLMALETDTLCGAASGERSAERVNQCNGYRDRDWQTRAGTVELRIPALMSWMIDGYRAARPLPSDTGLIDLLHRLRVLYVYRDRLNRFGEKPSASQAEILAAIRERLVRGPV